VQQTRAGRRRKPCHQGASAMAGSRPFELCPTGCPSLGEAEAMQAPHPTRLGSQDRAPHRPDAEHLETWDVQRKRGRVRRLSRQCAGLSWWNRPLLVGLPSTWKLSRGLQSSTSLHHVLVRRELGVESMSCCSMQRGVSLAF